MALSEANKQRRQTAIDRLYDAINALDDVKGELLNITATAGSDEQTDWWLDRCQEVVDAKITAVKVVDLIFEED